MYILELVATVIANDANKPAPDVLRETTHMRGLRRLAITHALSFVSKFKSHDDVTCLEQFCDFQSSAPSTNGSVDISEPSDLSERLAVICASLGRLADVVHDIPELQTHSQLIREQATKLKAVYSTSTPSSSPERTPEPILSVIASFLTRKDKMIEDLEAALKTLLETELKASR